VDHDGERPGEGGLALWRRLAIALGVSERELDDKASFEPGVRRACDGYVELVRSANLLEAVASSLTEFFAPALMQRRLEAWQRHYPWVPAEALDYFRVRVTRAEEDAGDALALVVSLATSEEAQARAIAALIQKTELLWQMLDAIAEAAQRGRR
jgi:pyrroloquinoline-quinone synthase